MKASNHEKDRYRLRAKGSFVDGEWSNYEVVPDGWGSSAVGSCTQRSGGGWICALPVKDPDTGRKIGIAYGRGDTPDEALKAADAKALQGVV